MYMYMYVDIWVHVHMHIYACVWNPDQGQSVLKTAPTYYSGNVFLPPKEDNLSIMDKMICLNVSVI